jgi:hypothetical protein
MAEVKIARFIGIDACMSVFSENSTFVLRSPEHYRRLYETTAGTDTKGDRDEGRAKTISGGTAEYTGFLFSCWTILKGNEPTPDEWDIFGDKEQNVVAIVTTPTLVAEFLKTALHVDRPCEHRRFPFVSLDHHGVSYGKQDFDHRDIIDGVPFTKNSRFTKEQEYRFVLHYTWLHVIDSLVFCAGITYMEKRDDNRLSNFANPQMSRENKEKLLLTLMTATAGYGDFASISIPEIIANADVLF